MSNEASTASGPRLDEESRTFVKRAIATGLVDIDQVKKVVASLMSQNSSFDPRAIAGGLVGSGALTTWQANKLLAGKNKGFYLGSYRLLRPLGKGGMGVVYLGEHHVMKRMMALKILPAESLSDPRRIQRFKEEARASAQLDHPNIVRAVDFTETEGRLFIVMEFVDGTDLQHAIARDGVMPIAMAVDVMVQAAQGLAHAHERGIIHRDIKPSNLMMRTDGLVKVSDMGLARIGWADAEGVDGKRMLMGTADFVAPEQAIDSRAVDARADLYSLGCTLFFLLTGRPPFTGASVAHRLAKHQTAPPPDIRRFRKDCPASLAELAMRMMAKRPEDRPKSAVDLVNQIKRLGGMPSSPAAMSAPRRIAPAGDSAVDDSVYQATIDDSSLSSNGEVPVVVVVDDFDFSNLPDIPPITPAAAQTHRNTLKTLPSHRMARQVTQPAAAKPARSAAAGDRQQLLLGMGLAIAVLALLATVSMTAYTLAKPEKLEQPKIRSIEDDGSGQIIVVRQ